MPMVEKVWWIYVVRCSDDSLYCGITTDVVRRVEEHNGGSRGAKYTRSRRPVTLESSWPAENRSAALKSEYAFKKLSRQKKLDFLKHYCEICRQVGCECHILFGFHPTPNKPPPSQ